MAIRVEKPSLTRVIGRLVASLVIALVSVTTFTVALGQGGPRPDAPEVDRIPERPADAISGSAFAARTIGWTGAARQRAILTELTAGNLPRFLRNLQAVEMTWQPSSESEELAATVWVMPDYLAVGSDEDFLRVPLDFKSAVKVANLFGFILPTAKIVDAVSQQAAVHLQPIPMQPGPKMRSSEYYLRHQRSIERQRGDRPLGLLTAGHKKDVVITNRLYRRPGRIAIYGWHRANGDPIQPLSTVHGGSYADYSHGVRLVFATVWVDGRPQAILDMLKDPTRAPLLTYEGVIRDPRRLMTP